MAVRNRIDQALTNLRNVSGARDLIRAFSESAKYENGKAAEGVVIAAANGRWSFKAINPNYKEA